MCDFFFYFWLRCVFSGYGWIMAVEISECPFCNVGLNSQSRPSCVGMQVIESLTKFIIATPHHYVCMVE